MEPTNTYSKSHKQQGTDGQGKPNHGTYTDKNETIQEIWNGGAIFEAANTLVWALVFAQIC